MPAPTVPQSKPQKFTDKQLRADVQAGMKAVDIAAKYGVSRSAVSQRVKQLNLTTTVAAVQPYEARRYVRQSIDAMEQIGRNLEKANLLMDACDEWLRDADDPSRYDIGARADEVEVTYEVEIITPQGVRYEKRKKPLTYLMEQFSGQDEDGARFCGWKHGETKRADPRDLILKTSQETRGNLSLAADLARTLADIRVMHTFREVTLQEISKVAPEVAERIAEAVRRSIVLQGLLDGGPIFSGNDAGQGA